MKIVTVIGARPQFVKAAVVAQALRKQAGLREVLLHTGQHYDPAMSQVFFDELGMPAPDHNLEVGSASHGEQTARMLAGIERVLLAERPNWVLVYGDTNSTLAGALAAAKLGIPLAHVEAGLRSHQRAMPEEINRVVTDRIADLLFAPTESAAANLRAEGIGVDKIAVVGDVMFDATLHYSRRANSANLLEQHRLKGKAFALVTIHRAENTDDPKRLAAIVEGLRAVALTMPTMFPMHPRTRAALERQGLLTRLEGGVICMEPLGYLDMLALTRAAAIVVTDSGGVQKEAFFLTTPCVIVRPTTEWRELVERGFAALSEPNMLPDTVRRMCSVRVPAGAGLFGGGAASDRIVETLLRHRVGTTV